MKVVIDTNCLIPSIPPNNPEYWLYLAFKNQDFDWHISNEILLEYEEQIGEFYSPRTAELVTSILLTAPNMVLSEPFIKWGLISDDPDDNKFADLAISANVNFLVTNDRHFNILKNLPFPTVKVVPLSEFQKILGY
ncbi:MAG TPA: putative toxin-antitoxin system toxin component, PIN family [Bacteroidetes bacterium]|nr:putative toxin-antitoxin system toxin component, PIN family [Bacteroidota bacterium]